MLLKYKQNQHQENQTPGKLVHKFAQPDAKQNS